MNSSKTVLLREEFNESDWLVVLDLGKSGININIYEQGEKIEGHLMSRIELSIFDYLVGAKRLSYNNKDIVPLQNIFRKHFPVSYNKFKELIT